MKIDSVTIKILREIALGETKIKRISEKIKVPRTTIIARLQRMFEKGGLTVRAAISYYELGLQPVVVFSDMDPYSWGIPYIAYTAKIVSYNGVKYLTLLTLPLKHLNKYLERIGENCIFKTYDPVTWIPDDTYAKIEGGKIKTDWLKMCKSARADQLCLPHTPRVKVKLDQIDLYTLEKLQQNSLEKLKRIADGLGIHPNLLLYHYHKHIQPLLLGSRVDFNFWDWKEAPLELYLFKASNFKDLQKILSIFRKSLNFKTAFIEVDRHQAITILQIPSWEKLDFMNALLMMRKRGLRKVMFLGLVDPSSSKYHVLPLKYFGKRGWLYAKIPKYRFKGRFNYES
ncbi:MAG: hypothetical protein DRJ44_05065 [Thermoprotei archaeon]|nr:MAG: hypothetical protein DRJ44_05065 [Thermoprotei archaeon]